MTNTTKINRSWLSKMVVFLVVLLGFGVWGYVDAIIVYPARGVDDASFKLKAYLEALQTAQSLSAAAITDPAAKRATLTARREELQKAAATATQLEPLTTINNSEAERAKRDLRLLSPTLADYACLNWLDSLARVGHLNPAETKIDNPAGKLDELTKKWKSSSPPKELASYDLTLQWLFMFLGFAGALYLLFIIVRAKRTVYTYDDQTHTLTLPTGKAIAPADIAEFDARKWDKFFVSLHLKSGGAPIKLDLLRYSPLEEWVLEMERVAFPEAAHLNALAKKSAAPSAEAPPVNEEPAPTEESTPASPSGQN